MASELATARSAYETRKENVIDRATARLDSITVLRSELAVEQDALRALLV